LTRERDFYKLSPTTICRVKGAHLYADVTNSHLLVAEAGSDKHEQKKLIRGLSVLRRMQGELADENEVGKIQMQAARFHGMCHKPYDGDQEDNEAGRARCAVIFGITAQSYLYDVFNEVFDDLQNFRGAVGIDSGRFLVANIGRRGDRELISLGSPANIAAKAIAESGTITVTKRVYELLPECLQEHFIKADDVAGIATYQASGLRWKSHPELSEKLGVSFGHDRWKKKTQDAKDNLVLSDMNVSGAPRRWPARFPRRGRRGRPALARRGISARGVFRLSLACRSFPPASGRGGLGWRRHCRGFGTPGTPRSVQSSVRDIV